MKHLKSNYLFLSLFSFYFFIVAFLFDHPNTILEGLYQIIIMPDLLITDYISIGGIGATFMNASLTGFITLFILYRLKIELKGEVIVAFFMMLGFAMFGKNILNIWLILLGVYVYAKYHEEQLSDYIIIGFYGTSLSPIVTHMLQLVSIPPVSKLILTGILGVMMGFVLPPLTKYLHSTHKGYSLYNVGFSAGVLSTVVVSVMKSFGIESKSVLFWSTGNNKSLFIILMIYFITMILYGIYKNPTFFNEYTVLLQETGVNNPDFTIKFNIPVVFINMGINGIVATIIVLLVGGDLNGPTIGGICSIVGFSATGKHLFNILPILFGVYFASLFKVWDIHDPACMITLLFSTTLAPIAGKYGPLVGIIAGFIHSSVALNIIGLYDGMNLYNNGFAGGFVACFLVPIIDSFHEKKRNLLEL